MDPLADPPYGTAPAGHRLPAGTHVGAVHLQVSDLQRSIDYYPQVIGLYVLGQAGNVVALGAADGQEPLVHLHGDRSVRSARRGAFGLCHFALLLPDRAALGRFTRHIADLDMRVGMADHLVSEALYLSDPDGLGIEVYADRPRSSWQQRGRELAMTTERWTSGISRHRRERSAGPARRQARRSATCTCTSATSKKPRPSTTRRSGSTKRCGPTPARSSEVAHRLRALPGLEQVELVAVTGYGQKTDRRRTREAGFDEHLVGQLDEWLRRSELRRQRPQFRHSFADR